MLVMAAVTSTRPDEEGVEQPLAFTEQALEIYLNAVYGVERPNKYLAQTIKWLLKDGGLHEYKRDGKYYYVMPRHSMNAFERMMGYYPDPLELG
jgi:hypothetical protein